MSETMGNPILGDIMYQRADVASTWSDSNIGTPDSCKSRQISQALETLFFRLTSTGTLPMFRRNSRPQRGPRERVAQPVEQLTFNQ